MENKGTKLATSYRQSMICTYVKLQRVVVEEGLIWANRLVKGRVAQTDETVFLRAGEGSERPSSESYGNSCI